MYKNLDDPELMSLIVKGNHDAFAEMVTRHTDRFLALAYRTLQNRSDAEDVVQAAFIKVWQKPQAWDGSKSLFTTWFYRVVVNACHDHRRKHKRMVEIDDQVLDVVVGAEESEQEVLEQEQQKLWQKKCVEIAISKLPASQRDALNLVVYSELPQKQAAKVMNISLKALESLLVRAKRAMAKTVNELHQQADLDSKNVSLVGK